MPVFLQGRRAFLSSLRRRHRRCNPISVHRFTDSDLAYPRRAYSCFTYFVPLLLSPRLPRCGCRLPLLPSLCLLRCRRLRIPKHRTDRPPFTVLLGAPPRPAPLQLFYGTSHSRSPSLLCPGHKKGGRNRTEVRPPPKSNQSVAAASPRQLFNPSGQCTRLKQTRSV